MKICVDVSVWALALKKGGNRNSLFIKELHELIKEVRVQMLGPIRFELLASIRNKDQYEMVKRTLSEFPDLALKTADYEMAAEFSLLCDAHNITCSQTDLLICAASLRNSMPILTTKKEFTLLAEYIPITLLQPRG